MTFAQMLLAPIVALMLTDMVLTAKGQALGLDETNWMAVPLMKRLGTMQGMLVYEVALLSIIVAVVVLFPSQWALPLSLVVELLITVEHNRRVLKLGSSACT